MMSMSLAKTESDADIAAAFKVFDPKSSGFISVSDLKAVLSSLGENCSDEFLNSMLIAADADNDGKVSYQDFASMVKT